MHLLEVLPIKATEEMPFTEEAEMFAEIDQRLKGTKRGRDELTRVLWTLG